MRQMTIEKLLELYNTGERDFRGIKFIHPEIREFEGLNLSGIDLRYSDLHPFVFFTEINLSGGDLRGLDLSNRNIERANLSGADLSFADLYRSDLSGANLSGANLSGAKLQETILCDANLTRVDLSGSFLMDTYLGSNDLTEANFIYARDLKTSIDCRFKNTIMPNGSIRNS